jgi:hypothetical protein
MANMDDITVRLKECEFIQTGLKGSDSVLWSRMISTCKNCRQMCAIYGAAYVSNTAVVD